MGSGIEVVVIACIVGAVGFWIGWKTRMSTLMNYVPGPSSPSIGDLCAGALENPPDAAAYQAERDRENHAMRVDSAAVHFAACLSGRPDGTRDPVAIVSEARALAEVLVAAECAASRRRPFFA